MYSLAIPSEITMAANWISLSLTCGVLLHLKEVSCVFQAELDYMSMYMDIQYDVLDNIQTPGSSRHRITLTNTGSEIIRGGEWSIYYTNIKGVSRPQRQQDSKYDWRRYGVEIVHVQGCHFCIYPTATFKPISPGSKLEIFYQARGSFISRTDIYPNWYITAPGLAPRTLLSTADENLAFVGDFDTANKWKRWNSSRRRDRYNPYLPEKRRQRYNVRDLAPGELSVLPTPVSIKRFDATRVKLSTLDWLIYLEPESGTLEAAARLLSRDLVMRIVRVPPRRRFIELRFGLPDVNVDGILTNSSEAYQLIIEARAEKISIVSPSSAGAFYAYQSMKSIMSSDATLPSITIKDAPRYPFRGLHLDVGRNFQSKSAVLKLIDAMAMYKLNKLQLHLAEDEGWRLEIPGLEELTQFGSQRCHDQTKCLVPQLGSGPTNQTSGSGFYSLEDYKEILHHAKERFITVVPEFDMPGHSRAAVKSMEKRYENFLQRGDPNGATQYLLSDLQDTTRYSSVQMFNDNTINPCIESTYRYINHLITALKDLHEGIQPLAMFHFGGDEVPGAWVNSTRCQTFLRQHPEIDGVEDLKRYFSYRVSNITAALGLDLGAWWWGLMDKNSNAFDRSRMLNRNVIGYSGNNVWEWGGANRAYTLANAGFKVVMCPSSHLFFDHPYEPDPEERGFYWAGRFIDTKKIFGYMPDRFYDNADVTVAGAPFTRRDLCGADGTRCVPLRRPENIQGLQALVWSETIRTEEEMNYMIFPRLLAMSERAWHIAPWESTRNEQERTRLRDLDWEIFANKLGKKELLRLDELQIKYRVPPPGASIDNGRLLTSTTFPGLSTEVSFDGGLTWRACKYEIICGEIQLRTRSASGSRVSRTVKMSGPRC